MDGCTVPNIDFLKATNSGVQWDFDCYGNPVPWPKKNELFKTYKVDDKLYFSITTIRTNQDDLMEMDVYIFDTYVEGKFESHGSVTSKIGYRSVNDCYDGALAFIYENWELLKQYFEVDMPDPKPDIPTFHPTPGDNEAKIGKYFYTIDETGIWKDKPILIKHLHPEI